MFEKRDTPVRPGADMAADAADSVKETAEAELERRHHTLMELLEMESHMQAEERVQMAID